MNRRTWKRSLALATAPVLAVGGLILAAGPAAASSIYCETGTQAAGEFVGYNCRSTDNDPDGPIHVTYKFLGQTYTATCQSAILPGAGPAEDGLVLFFVDCENP
ncbi:hypothetical protein [Streptomyces sp. NPDC058657]|uniref:hypothetical protein n=1 Tax=unclassified Streptomyces TaxID=2593676 RepID=UPI0036558268